MIYLSQISAVSFPPPFHLGSRRTGILFGILFFCICGQVQLPAQSRLNWELGAPFSFNTRDDGKQLPNTFENLNIGKMTKKSDRWLHSYRLAFRKFTNDGSGFKFLAILGYKQNVIKYLNQDRRGVLGYTWQQTDYTMRHHYVSLGLGMELDLYEIGSHSFLLRLEGRLLINLIQEEEVIFLKERALNNERFRDRFYERINRLDSDTEDYEGLSYSVGTFQASYEINFTNYGFRLFLGPYLGIEFPPNIFIPFSFISGWEMGAAFIF